LIFNNLIKKLTTGKTPDTRKMLFFTTGKAPDTRKTPVFTTGKTPDTRKAAIFITGISRITGVKRPVLIKSIG
jgi:hypothetical protein